MLKSVLEDFCQSLSIKMPLENAADSSYTLVLNQEMSFVFKNVSPGFCIEAKVGDAPEGTHEDFYIHLMKANYLGQGTGGCTLALTPDTKFVMLVLNLKQDVNAEELKNHLELFANYLDYWRHQLNKYKTTKAS